MAHLKQTPKKVTVRMAQGTTSFDWFQDVAITALLKPTSTINPVCEHLCPTLNELISKQERETESLSVAFHS